MTDSQWTKDYIEHIRTVHFSLIAVAVGLLAIVFTSRQSEITTAHQQAKDILDIVRGWDPGWIQGYAEKRMEDFRDERNELFRKETRRVSDPITIRVDGPAGPQILRLRFPEPNWTIAAPKPLPSQADSSLNRFVEVLEPSTRLVFFGAPKSLADFKNFWDALNEGVYVRLPGPLVGKYSVYKSYPYSNSPAAEFPGRNKWVDLNPINSAPADKEVQLYLVALSQNDVLTFVYQGAPGNFQSNYAYVADLPGYPGNRIILFATGAQLFLSLDPQGELVARFAGRWRRGKFSDAFREIDTATSGYQQTDLAPIEAILSNEERHSAQSFEAFGIKFPAEGTTGWGMVLVLGMQLYLWLHLRELTGRLRPEDPGWDVAWIGLYGTTISRIVLFVSTCLLPVIAVGCLAIRLVRVNGIFRVYWVASPAAGLAAIFLAYVCWKNMPHQSPAYTEARRLRT